MLTLLTLTSLASADCQAPYPSPGAEWTDRSSQVDQDLASQLDAALFPTPRDDQTRAGVRTDGVAVFYQGELIYERYGGSYTAQTPHLIWSASKSFMSVLQGMAEQRGVFNPADSVCNYVELETPAACQVSVTQLMEFSSGLAWRETYEGSAPTASSVLAMLYGQGSGDMAAFTAAQGFQDVPGSTYQYSSGDSNLLAAAVGASLVPLEGERYPWTMLFEPLGITSATWERDGAGTPVGSSYLYMTPRDMGRFGQFLLNDGCLEGARLLPQGWLSAATTLNPAAASGQARERGPGENQGRQFWLNVPNPVYGEGPRHPDIPTTAFAAQGHWAQRIWVLPEQGVVAVRTGDDRDGSYSDNDWVPLAIALAQSLPAPESAPEPLESVVELELGPLSELACASDTSSPQPDSIEPPCEATTALSSQPAPPAEPPGKPAAPFSGELAPPPDKFDSSLLNIATAFAAKEGCSCVFVSGRDEDECRAYIRVDPDIAKIKVDHERKRVTSRALGMSKTTAVWVSQEEGCRLE